jgi:hypothetical protein
MQLLGYGFRDGANRNTAHGTAFGHLRLAPWAVR